MTDITTILETNYVISIHTALAGCDLGWMTATRVREMISIHTALAGCDAAEPDAKKNGVISIHTALAGCDKLSKTERGW